MTLLELMISSLMSSAILASLGHSGLQMYQSLERQHTQTTLQNEALQAMHMMGQAIQNAGNPVSPSTQQKQSKDAFKLMAKDSAGMSNSQVNQFVIRKGAASMDGSDAFYTHSSLDEIAYQAFFVQQQGHHEQRDGVLYLQTRNKKGRLQNDALIGHVQSMQIQVGILQNHSIKWLEPYELSEKVSKTKPHWNKVRALRIHLKLQKGNHPLEVTRIFALRHAP
jgi:type II secretory pathway component PulJ